MGKGGRSFPDVPGQLHEMYDSISEVVADIRDLQSKLSDGELVKLAADFKKVVRTINLICGKTKVPDDTGTDSFFTT